MSRGGTSHTAQAENDDVVRYGFKSFGGSGLVDR
jgi:hypothetical protein